MSAVLNSDQTSYEKVEFEKLELSNDVLDGCRFDQCKFIKCNFSELSFKKCQFVDCEFLHCNLRAIKVNQSSFIDVVFEDSKVTGVNWSYAHWPQINLTCPLHFLRCDISLSSFFELSIAEMVLEDSRAHGVDFRGADLSRANFAYTDFLDAQFMHTKLIGVDFTEASNYRIDPQLNEIKSATFSFPEVIALLQDLEINIIGL